mmetsp:Transcript_46139/g.116802  ORF Transcript_46139/g.116802 Transcript_46139/m.116802 type:complete len:242 (-) Transcript_46139:308-1033(-)|eukprot:jgi/Tetstr1/423911/TSEL_014534.t1
MTGPTHRILCLHGLYQNSRLFARKCDGLQRLLGDQVDLVHMDGTYGATPKPRLPNLRPPEGREDGGLVREERYRAWWNNGCTGWDDTLYDHIQRKLDADGPFFGVLGFSQGATCAGLLCTEHVSSRLGFRPKVAVVISGRRSIVHDAEYESGIVEGVDSLHCFGANDQITSPEKSRELVSLFQSVGTSNTFVHEHAGGHIIPDVEQQLGHKIRVLFSSAGVDMPAYPSALPGSDASFQAAA